MILTNMLVAAAIAMVMVLVATMISGRRPAGVALLAFFLVVLMAAWAGSAWITAGPAVLGVYWFPAIVTAEIFAFVLAVAMPDVHPARVTPEDRASNIGKPGGGYPSNYATDVIARARRLHVDEASLDADRLTSADEGVQ